MTSPPDEATERPERAPDWPSPLALALTGIAGCVDAVGFLKLGGFFVSFMSGNSTQLGVGLTLTGGAAAGEAAVLVAIFFAGVFAGALVGWAAEARRRPTLLTLEAVLLVVAVQAAARGGVGFGVGLVVLAMGMQNAVLKRPGAATAAPTYVTGLIVRAAETLADAVTGRAGRLAWASPLLLWAGLVAGGAIGAGLYARFTFAALLWPAAALALLSLREFILPRSEASRP